MNLQGSRWKDLSVLQRNEIWLNNRNKKISSAREEKINKATEGCTFEPKLKAYKPPRAQSRNVTRHDISNAHDSSVNVSHNASTRDDKGQTYAQLYEKRQSMRSRSFDQL